MRKKALLLCIVMFALFGHINAQTVVKDKYFIQLPDAWKNQPKFLYKLTGVIESTIPQLRGKELCLDCDAPYKVKFYVTQPLVDYVFYKRTTRDEFTSICYFFSFMDVWDSTGKIVHRLILNDSTIAQTFTFSFYTKRNDNVQQSIGMIKASSSLANRRSGNTFYNNPMYFQEAQSRLAQPFNWQHFANANRAALTPTPDALWLKVKELIMDYKIPESHNTQ